MKTFFVVFSFIMCSDLAIIKYIYIYIYMNEIFKFDMHMWAIMGERSSIMRINKFNNRQNTRTLFN